MKHYSIFALTLAALLLPLDGRADEGVQRPLVVVELFTSQGCSSCPPADAFLQELAQHEDVLTLSLAVDYWDYLGWRDTLALKGHTERQYGYAEAHTDGMVYTPQMVINGTSAMVGNRRSEVTGAVEAKIAASPLHDMVAFSRDDSVFQITFSGHEKGRYVLWLIPLRERAEIDVAKGENAGRQLSYVNIPLTWHNLGLWSGGEASFEFSLTDRLFAGADGCAVLVQEKLEKGQGPIVAAAKLRF